MLFKRLLPFLLLTTLVLACQTPPEDVSSQGGNDVENVSVVGDVEDYADEQRPDDLSFYESPEDASLALELIQEKEELTLEDGKLLIALYITEQNLDEAAALGDQWLEQYPEDLELIYMRALVANQLDQEEQRDELIEWGLSLDESNGELNLLRASVLVNNQRYSQANQHLSLTLRADPNHFQALILKAQVLMHLGEGNDELNDQFLWEAVETLNTLEQVQPDYPYTYVDRARVLGVLGEAGRAYQDLGVAINLQPDVEWHYVDRARISLKYMNDRENALEDLKVCESINPDNFLAMVYLAGIYFDELDFQEALKYSERVLSLRPDYYYAYEQAGVLYYSQGMYEQSAEAFLKAYEVYNPNEGYPLMAALAMKQMGQHQQSQRLLTEVARSLDRDSLAYEMYRYFIEGGSDYYVLDRLRKEDDDIIRRRFNYYLGEYYLFLESEASAMTCFSEASELTFQFESRVAQWHLQ